MADLDALDPLLLRPRYTYEQVAALFGLRTATVQAWAGRRSYRGADGSQRHTVPLVTTAGTEPVAPVPFIGLAEAYVLAVLSAAGVSVVRLRPALSYLARELDPVSPLTSQALLTDGADILGRYSDPAVFAPVLDAHHGQTGFRAAVEHYLQKITYRAGRAAAIELPQREPRMMVDPRVNFGRPSPAADGS